MLGLALVPIAGYVVSRTTGLPGATDDIGDWANALGLATLAVEAALVALAVRAAPMGQTSRQFSGPLRRAEEGSV